MVMCFAMLAACGSKDTGAANTGAANTGGGTTTMPTTAVTDSSSGSLGTVDTAVKYKDTVRLSVASEISNGAFYCVTSAQSGYISAMTHQALTEKDVVTGELVGSLAKSWEDTSGNGTVWEFKLDETARFHHFDVDYAPVTSEDVKWTFEWATPGGPGVQEGVVIRTLTAMNQVDTIETPDDHTVIFKLKSPVFDFDEQITSWRILSEKSMEEFGHIDGQDTGSGPYYINYAESFNAQYWTLTRFDDYWKGIENHATKNVVFVIHPEQNTGVAALQAGEVDGIPGIKAENALLFQGNDDYKFYNINGISPASIFFNSHAGKGMFDNEDTPEQIKLRQAIKLAIDRDGICAVLYAANPAAGDRADNLFNESSGTGVVTGYVAEYNVEKAQAMMKELGYNENNKLKIKLCHYVSYTNYAQIVQDQLKNIYIDAQCVQFDTSVFGTTLRTGEGWDMAVNYYGPGTTLSNCMLVNLRSNGSNAGAYGWSSEEMDKRIDNVLAQTTLESQLSAYAEFQAWCNDYAPRIPTHAGNTMNLMVAEMEGYMASAVRTDYTTIRIPE